MIEQAGAPKMESHVHKKSTGYDGASAKCLPSNSLVPFPGLLLTAYIGNSDPIGLVSRMETTSVCVCVCMYALVFN